MTEEDEVTMSPLCEIIERDGQCVQVDIYENGVGGWILELVDKANNSRIWDDHFSSDQQAFDAAIEAIEKEGIHAFIN